MNWRRGLIRVWIAGTAIWTSGVAFFTFWDNRPAGLDLTGLTRIYTIADFSQFVLRAFIPPVVVLILGIASDWIIRGFKSN